MCKSAFSGLVTREVFSEHLIIYLTYTFLTVLIVYI